jgi:hypothetical protein
MKQICSLVEKCPNLLQSLLTKHLRQVISFFTKIEIILTNNFLPAHINVAYNMYAHMKT